MEQIARPISHSFTDASGEFAEIDAALEAGRSIPEAMVDRAEIRLGGWVNAKDLPENFDRPLSFSLKVRKIPDWMLRSGRKQHIGIWELAAVLILFKFLEKQGVDT